MLNQLPVLSSLRETVRDSSPNEANYVDMHKSCWGRI